MKILSFISLFLFLNNQLFSQGDIALLDINKTKKATEAYDGIENYLKRQVYKYIGQTMRIKYNARCENKTNDYLLGFTKDYKIKKDKYGWIFPETYHPAKSGIGTDYSKIVNNIFEVMDVYSHPWANSSDENNKYNNLFYLKLHNLSLNDTAYYEYIASDEERAFPFILTKHLKHLRGVYLNKYVQLLGDQDDFISVLKPDYSEEVKVYGKSWWKCIDIIISQESGELSLILERNKEQIIVSLTTIKFLFKPI